MKTLNDVTLVVIAGVDAAIPCSIASMEQSSSHIKYGSKKMFCSNTELAYKFLSDTDIKPINLTLEGYSRFCIGELTHHINTDFCLIVQGDGFVIHPDLWEDAFLDYDYIGAPWSPVGPNEHLGNKPWVNRVGNGGFSLRSKKFLEASVPLESKYNPLASYLDPQLPKGESPVPEDWFLCVHNYKHMLSKGIKFADPSIAARFSVEHPVDENRYDPTDLSTYKSFGCHGSTNTGAMNVLLKAVKDIKKEFGS